MPPPSSTAWRPAGRAGAEKTGESALSKEVRSLYGGRDPGPRQPGDGPVALCTLGTVGLDEAVAAADPGAGACIGLAGPLAGGSHGVERLAWALLDRPTLRFLVVAGEEAQDRGLAGALSDLWAGRWRPPNLSDEEAAALTQQVELVDRAGLTDPAAVAAVVRSCAARDPGRWKGRRPTGLSVETVVAGEPEKCFPAPDPDGYFLISVDRPARRLAVERFTPDGRRTHVVRGATAEAVAAVLASRGLIRDPGHALYLGRELQKAEVALVLGLAYEQDVPLRYDRR